MSILEQFNMRSLKKTIIILAISFGLSITATAEEIGDNHTQQELAKLYLENSKAPNDSKKSYEWFAVRGYAPAQFMLGLEAYDRVNKIKWYQLAADNGHPSAQNNLANIYYIGKYGEPRNYAKAFKLYKMLADNNDVHAQYRLGDMYYHGAGIPQSYNQAFNYYQKAANNGSTDAEYILGLMYYSGLGIPQDYGKALNIFQKFADQGDTNAAYNI